QGGGAGDLLRGSCANRLRRFHDEQDGRGEADHDRGQGRGTQVEPASGRCAGHGARHVAHVIGIPGSYFSWRRIRVVLTLSTLAAPVSSLMMKSCIVWRLGPTHLSMKSASPETA